jgi:hypothetical protein
MTSSGSGKDAGRDDEHREPERDELQQEPGKEMDEVDALRLLQQYGYSVKRTGEYKKRTFEVEEGVYRAFRALQESLGLKVKDAFNFALAEWVRKHSAKN